MTLRTKSIKAPPEAADGVRVSIMSRHTLPDGVTPDPEITHGSYDEWVVALAPPPRLIGDYYRRELPWEEFADRYLAWLERDEASEPIRDLLERARSEDVTLLCVEDGPEYCHRRLLAEACRRLDPDLEVEIE